MHANSADGAHIASLAGAWSALVAGFGGLRVRGGQLLIDPALPDALAGLSFRLRWKGARLCVRVSHDEVVLEVPDRPVRMLLGPDQFEVTPDRPVRRPAVTRHALLLPPPQPPGMEPPRVDDVL